MAVHCGEREGLLSRNKSSLSVLPSSLKSSSQSSISESINSEDLNALQTEAYWIKHKLHYRIHRDVVLICLSLWINYTSLSGWMRQFVSACCWKRKDDLRGSSAYRRSSAEEVHGHGKRLSGQSHNRIRCCANTMDLLHFLSHLSSHSLSICRMHVADRPPVVPKDCKHHRPPNPQPLTTPHPHPGIFPPPPLTHTIS